MYIPRQFREDRLPVLLEAIERIRLATLIIGGNEEFHIVHAPVTVRRGDAAIVIESHVARANPVWRKAAIGTPSVAAFLGPHAYIHPGWLATKREHGRVVPTWNYVAVHAHGRLYAVEDAAWLRRHIAELTDVAEHGQADPWSVEDAPEEFTGKLVTGIVGLRFEVDRIEGAWKMMQHHPEANRRGVIDGLDSSGSGGSRSVADEMREHLDGDAE